MISGINMLQVALYLSIVLILVIPLGKYMAQVYTDGEPYLLYRFLNPIERLLYRLCGIQPKKEMEWKQYLFAMLALNLLGLLAVYLIQRLQIYLPLNPQNFPAVPPDIAFNTAASFVTNTDWQAYSGENTLSYFTQMLALTTQNFISAATGLSLLIALIRGLTRQESIHLGNFWVDTIRGILYILLPLSIIFAVILSSQGVIQNIKPYETISLLQPTTTITEQKIPLGPVASLVAIKQLGTNGGGFFNTNSAHPFENPTPLTNFLEMIAILLIPAALCYTFGKMAHDKRQGWALLAAMFIIFIPSLSATIFFEHAGNPALTSLGIAKSGNMEGKETRIGVLNSALWAVATTATSNGSVNAMHDSFTPLGGLVPLWLMHLGEVVFGGVGCGLYSMLLFVIITVFITGLMVGRTPEYLGKKIEPYEMKMAAVATLIMPLIVLCLTAIGCVLPLGKMAIANPGAHGFSEILYAFTSMGNNNGSSFAGLQANAPFYTIIGGIEMLVLRYWIAIPVLAIAGSLARKKITPSSSGTLPTHNLLFIILLISIIITLGTLSFFPSLAIGPLVEQLMLWRQYGH